MIKEIKILRIQNNSNYYTFKGFKEKINKNYKKEKNWKKKQY